MKPGARRRIDAARWSLLALTFAAASARAVISCNAAVTSIAVNHDPVVGTQATGSYTISCTRASGDAATVAYTLEADNGLSPQGQNRRVRLGATANYYAYGMYTDTFGGNRWGTMPPGQRAFSGTINFGGLLTASASAPFYLQIPASAAGPAGTYTDIVGTTLTYGGFTSLGAFNVSAITFPTCTLVLPATVTFNYTSFQAAPASTSANFNVTCTTGLPYTMALDQTGVTDDAVNLAYTLSLSAAGGTGTGAAATYTINGSMAAGQAGTCAAATCSNAAATNRTRTLTVTY